MSALKRVLAFLGRVVGYASLAAVVVAAAILFLFRQTNLCPSFSEGRVACATPFYQSLGEFAMGVTLATAYTGLPLLFALIGAIFAVKDLRAWRARRTVQPPSIL